MPAETAPSAGSVEAQGAAMEEAGHLVVARFLRAHGLKGAALVSPFTDQPEVVFVPGRSLVQVDAQGEPNGPELVVSSGRPRGREWLLMFGGIATRAVLEQRGLDYLGAARDQLRVLGPNEMYLHELPGAQVVAAGEVIGIVREVVAAADGQLLVMEAGGREHLIPFRAPILKRLDRSARRIEVDLPPGLLEL